MEIDDSDENIQGHGIQPINCISTSCEIVSEIDSYDALFQACKNDVSTMEELRSILLVNYKNLTELSLVKNYIQQYKNPYDTVFLVFNKFVHDEPSANQYLNVLKLLFLGDQNNKYSKVITNFVAYSIDIFSSNNNYDKYMNTFFNIKYDFDYILSPYSIFHTSNPWGIIDFCSYILTRWYDNKLFSGEIPWSALCITANYLSDMANNNEVKKIWLKVDGTVSLL